MTRPRTPRNSVIRLTTGHAASTLNHPRARRAPVLALDFGATSVLVTTSGPVTKDDLDFARQLAREAHRFARSVERSFYGLPDGQGVAA